MLLETTERAVTIGEDAMGLVHVRWRSPRRR